MLRRALGRGGEPQGTSLVQRGVAIVEHQGAARQRRGGDARIGADHDNALEKTAVADHVERAASEQVGKLLARLSPRARSTAASRRRAA